MFQRGADQPGLIVQHPVAFLPLQPHDVADIGLQDHGAAIGGAMFADLNPAAADHADVEDDMIVGVPPHPLCRPVARCLVFRQGQIARAADQIDILAKGDAGAEPVSDIRHMQAKARVAHDQPLVGIEEGKPLLHRLDGIGQVRTRLFCGAVGLGQAGVGIVEKVERAFQVAGAVAHLFLEQRGALELGIGRARGVGGLFHTAHQGGVDLDQLFDLPVRRVGGVEQRSRHGASQIVGWVDGHAGQRLIHMHRVELFAIRRETDNTILSQDV